MKALAGFAMRGRSQAAMVVAAAAVLSLVMPLVGVVSSATVALVTLRQGAAEGLLVGLFAGLASGLLAFLGLGSPLPAIGFALALWLPVLLLAVVLRHTRSLGVAVQLGGLFGLLILAVIHLQTGDPAGFWAELLEPVRQNLVDSRAIDDAGSEALVAQVARWMTGAFSATFYFQVLLALFLGRWWQALLYNPGGFGEEFRALRLHPATGYAALVLTLVVSLGESTLWAAELLLLLAPLFFLQGMAVVHGLARAFDAHRAWLIGFYALLILALPHAEILVAGLGLLDIWLDLRSRVAPRNEHEG